MSKRETIYGINKIIEDIQEDLKHMYTHQDYKRKYKEGNYEMLSKYLR